MNGHEHQATSGLHLQHSCIFPLRTPRDCSDAAPEDYFGNPELVADCRPNQRRLVRFVGTQNSPIPWPNSTVFVACRTEAFPQ